MNKVAAVVVTYNRKELLKQCIECLLAQEEVQCDVLVFDNASTDGTGDMVKSSFDPSRVVYHNTGKNLGGAGGFELGVKMAVEAGYEYVWIMDDDTLPKRTALLNLRKADETLQGHWGFLSSVAYWTDGSYCQANIQKKDVLHRLKAKDYTQPLIRVLMASFVSLLVKSSVVKELGCPIGEYFIWTDDYEFTGRIAKRYPGYVVTDSVVTHAMQVHTRVRLATATRDRIDRYHYLFRNDVHCYRQHGIRGWAYVIGKDIYNVIDVIRTKNEHKKEKIMIVLNGFKDGFHFQPVIKMPKQ